MEHGSISGTIRELIGELNTLRSHITHSTNGAPGQLRREILMVRKDVIAALHRFQADENDRRYLEKSFTQLRQMLEEFSRSQMDTRDHSRFKAFLAKLDRKCCNIQLFLSEIDFPKITS